jgi:hypothetical protein
MGLAGYRGIGQGKESTYAPVNATAASSPVVRLDPHQISNNVMTANSSGVKRATASSPTRENTDREKKARYDSPPRDVSNPSHSPARSIPSAISIPPRTVTTMIEVLNPSRVTPTGNSPMTASEMVSPSQRVNEDDSPRRELPGSPTRPQSAIREDKALEARKEPQIAEPPVAASTAPSIKSPVATSPRPIVNAVSVPPPASPAREQATTMPSVTATPAPTAPDVAKPTPSEETGNSQERREEKPDIREAEKAQSDKSPEVSKASEDVKVEGNPDDRSKSAGKEREAMDTSL